MVDFEILSDTFEEQNQEQLKRVKEERIKKI